MKRQRSSDGSIAVSVFCEVVSFRDIMIASLMLIPETTKGHGGTDC